MDPLGGILVSEGGPFVWHDPVPSLRSGMLDGWGLGVKDLISVAGHPLRAGSRMTDGDEPATADARIVTRLRRQGATVLGATAMHELGCGVTGVNESSGWPRNPLDERRVPGGSSSGSAVAVARGMVRLALGTDTGGSVRIPAALCGVYGMKPTRGAISLEGVRALAPSLDHLGLIASQLGDLVVGLAAAGVPGSDPSLPRDHFIVGVVTGELDACDPEVASPVSEAVDRLGGSLRLLEVCLPDHQRVHEATNTVMFAELAAGLDGVDTSQLGADVAARVEHGSRVSVAEYRSALEEMAAIAAEAEAAMSIVDACVGPTVPVLAPLVEQAHGPDVSARLVRFTRLANATGHAAVSLPLPVSGRGVGLQVQARTDSAALGAASAIDHLLRREA